MSFVVWGLWWFVVCVLVGVQVSCRAVLGICWCDMVPVGVLWGLVWGIPSGHDWVGLLELCGLFGIWPYWLVSL